MPWLTSLYNPANMRYALRTDFYIRRRAAAKMIWSRFAFSFDSKSSMVKCSISIVCMVSIPDTSTEVPPFRSVCGVPHFLSFSQSANHSSYARSDPSRLCRGYSPHFLSFTVPLFYFPLSENSCAAGQQNSRVSGHGIFAAVPFLLSGLL